MQNTYNYISLIIIGILAYFLFSNGSEVVEVIKWKDKFIYDTTKVIKLDTVWQKKIVYLKPEKIVVHDTFIPDKDDTHIFTGTAGDSTLLMSYEATVDGTLLGIGLSYQLLKPKTITEYRDQVIYKTKILPMKKYVSGFYVGGGLGLSRTQGQIILGMSYVSKDKLMYTYNFDIVSKVHMIDAKYRIF